MGRDRRFRAAALFICLIWGGLVLRAAQIQLVEHDKWARRGESMRDRIEAIPAARGQIRTLDGQLLARTVLNWSLGVDPGLVEDRYALACALDSLGLVRAPEFLERLETNRDSRFFWISRDILTEQRLDHVLRRFRCLVASSEAKRLYPLGSAGGALIGLMGRDEVPLAGLESTFDRMLRGRDGKILRISDATGRWFQGFYEKVLEEPRPGSDIEVTIDLRLQEIAAARLAAGVDHSGARAGYVIVTRPATGEILAMASVPSLDPTDPETWSSRALHVHPVTDATEPGSSFKLVAFAAALEAGLLDLDEPVDCMKGRRDVPGGRIKDHEPLAVVPAREVFVKSSNIGTGLLAERAGAERFYRMERTLGFGLPTGIPLAGEARGRVPGPDAKSWSARSLATMAFGQEVSCTGLQIAMAYGAVANGGNLMRPLLVRSVRDADGRTLQRWDPEVVRPALRPTVARQIRDLCREVVTCGTGAKAEIEWLRPAGKTSTAQKYDPELRTYGRGYTASFVGFAPVEDPQILCLVVLDEPSASIYGGQVAAPIFREILQDAAPLLEGLDSGLRPSPVRWACGDEDQRQEIPALEGLSAGLARRVVREAGLLPRLQGTGAHVTETAPPAGERVLPGTVVTLRLGDGAGAADGAVCMPDLSGLSLRDAWLRLHSAGLRPQVHGKGWVLAQDPPPGRPVRAGEICRVILGPDLCGPWKEYRDIEERASWAVAAGDLSVDDFR